MVKLIVLAAATLVLSACILVPVGDDHDSGDRDSHGHHDDRDDRDDRHRHRDGDRHD